MNKRGSIRSWRTRSSTHDRQEPSSSQQLSTENKPLQPVAFERPLSRTKGGIVLVSILVVVGIVIAAAAVLGLLLALLYSSLYKKVPQGKALVVSTTKAVLVSFTGRLVIPIIHKAEIMDTSVKTIEIDRRAAEGLICRDNIRADIKVNFFVRVNKAEEDVIKVAQSIGVERASSQATLEELFVAKFSEALKTVGKGLDFEDLYTERRRFRDEIIEVIGTDLNGYVLEDAAIDYLEQTPLSHLDGDNILDAQGIRKITELTAVQHVATNIASREEEKQIKAKDVETREAVLELLRQQADAEARQAREVSTVQAREQAETIKVQNEERLRAERARLATDEEVAVTEQNLDREVAVAEKNKERVVAVEQERVEKARKLEVVAADVEVTAAAKALETEKAGIAQIQRERVSVEKTVAEEEEAIATLRVVEEANRQRDAVVIEAEAEAQGEFVKDIKKAEAAEQAAAHVAAEQVTVAKANLEASDLDARAQIRLAEAQQAQTAADGLAHVQVREADAIAIEKLGFAEARVKEADAAAIAKTGDAEASAVEALLRGEAAGLTDKAAAMRELEGVGQEFEEFVRKLEVSKVIDLARVEAEVGIANAQAEVISKGLESATIDIVGGSDMFIDRLVSSVANGKTVDSFVTTSGESREKIVQELGSLLENFNSEDLRDMSAAAALKALADKMSD